MNSRNKASDLINEGFSPEQFGRTTADWNAYGMALLEQTAVAVAERTGTLANSNDAAVVRHLTLAERYLACAALWQRRINRMEADTVIGGDGNALPMAIQQFRANKQAYEADAEREFAAIAGATSQPKEASSGPAFGAVVSSHF
ncbi:hypothetical protein [Mariprofundus ferrooxydans]|uniref:hypothetical protein n=1 Tax=Mariprofundus ferrooxydans TaxID=314344 RepID=UPI001431FD2C|nr:hypothetical protein [Mariprofundus ferrooxydans]